MGTWVLELYLRHIQARTGMRRACTPVPREPANSLNMSADFFVNELLADGIRQTKDAESPSTTSK